MTGLTERGSTRQWRTTREAILTRDHHTCQIHGPRCTTTATEVDHILNRARGGTDDPNNLQAACPTCHADKTATESNTGRRRRQLPEHRRPGQHPGLLLPRGSTPPPPS